MSLDILQDECLQLSCRSLFLSAFEFELDGLSYQDVNMVVANEYDKSCFPIRHQLLHLTVLLMLHRFSGVDLNNDSPISAKENDHFSDEMNEVSPTAVSLATNEHIEPTSNELNDVVVALPLKVDVNVHSKKTKLKVDVMVHSKNSMCANELDQVSLNKREGVVNQQFNERKLPLKYLKNKTKAPFEVNILTHTEEVIFTSQHLSKIKTLKQKYAAEDLSKLFKVLQKDNFAAKCKSMLEENISLQAGDDLSVLNGSSLIQDVTVTLPNDSTSHSRKRKEVQDEIINKIGSNSGFPLEKETDEAPEQDIGSISHPMESVNMHVGQEFGKGGAVWDIFRRQDVCKLEEYLGKHCREFRHLHCSQVDQVFHPIHDQVFYLNSHHKRKLKEEFGEENVSPCIKPRRRRIRAEQLEE
ncbi:hypothetical protein Fmac_014356 [Flemingia macrophylla]|uniref:Uncharacterized protein n=1 Tax=Flemingia macrophylla TaxID=520843 RepID=A0ABD1MBI7_9FABA